MDVKKFLFVMSGKSIEVTKSESRGDGLGKWD